MHNDLIQRARTYATTMHERINQRRKYTLVPYHVHLTAVADLVASVSDDQHMIAAAWLHDTVEDTPVTFADLEQEFGKEVMLLVMELTDVSRPSDGNRATRKAVDRHHLAQVSQRAKTVKLADVIDNTRDISKHDQRFARIFLPEMHELLGVLQDGDPTLYAMARSTVDVCARQLQVPLRPLSQRTTQEGLYEDPSRLGNAFAQYRDIQLFAKTFTAKHIQEPLRSFDSTISTKQLEDFVLHHPCPVIGIRHDGQLNSYLTVTDGMTARDVIRPRPFAPQQLVQLDTPLVDVIHVLTNFDYCFVAISDSVIGAISRSDIEKPVVRMWLFGLIILIDMSVSATIKNRWPDSSWQHLVTPARLEKAQKLYNEHQRRQMSGELFDCLQLADKMQLLFHEPSFLEESGYASLNAARRVFKGIETLRNNLAHGQDIISTDWPSIVRLAHQLGATPLHGAKLDTAQKVVKVS